MTISDEDKPRAQLVLERALTVFDAAEAVLQRTVERLKAEEAVSAGEVTSELKHMGNALALALQMEVKAREAGSRGQIGAGQLDLDGARAEIGVRLACLRAAGGGGGIPGEPE